MLTGEYIKDYPEIVNEWDYKKNESYKIETMRAHTRDKVWWVCKMGHGWLAQVSSRTRKVRPTGCPYCAGKRAIPGETDLGTNYPELLSEWDWEKNEKPPSEYLPQSNSRVYWICKEGHSFESKICNRVNGRNCPYCSGKKPIKGVNDFATIYPEIASTWDYSKNEKGPSDYLPASNHLVSWKCSKGHSWKRKIYVRVHSDCPYCGGKRAIKGVNDILTLYPELAPIIQIDENRNINLGELTSKSGQTIWNRCKNGHLYKAKVYNCTMGKGCSICKRGYLR